MNPEQEGAIATFLLGGKISYLEIAISPARNTEKNGSHLPGPGRTPEPGERAIG